MTSVEASSSELRREKEKKSKKKRKEEKQAKHKTDETEEWKRDKEKERTKGRGTTTEASKLLRHGVQSRVRTRKREKKKRRDEHKKKKRLNDARRATSHRSTLFLGALFFEVFVERIGAASLRRGTYVRRNGWHHHAARLSFAAVCRMTFGTAAADGEEASLFTFAARLHAPEGCRGRGRGSCSGEGVRWRGRGRRGTTSGMTRAGRRGRAARGRGAGRRGGAGTAVECRCRGGGGSIAIAEHSA
jgi:hypothetical protein